jgi:RNA 2',3'-cyclic 3'-phosphodiesterase
MRLFVAVEVDDRVRHVAGTAVAELQRAVGPALKARWVPVENMHLTVRFIGHVDDTQGAAVIEALTPPLDIPPFEIELGGCGVFPASGPPRVVWIGLTRGMPLLASLHEEFNRRLRPLGFEPEARMFSAHLTLARIKDAPRGAARAVRAALDRVSIPATRLAVGHATILESHLSPRGPRYVPVAQVTLSEP